VSPRRPAPRPIAIVLGEVTREAAPAGVLARLQAAWGELAGPAIAAEAEPVAERSGRVTIACRSAVWAQELELLSRDLLERANAALGTAGDPHPVTALRFVVAVP
jgi:predicted nucleic acid-binding Zn ribbon protein